MATISGAISSYSRYNSGIGNFWTWLDFPATETETEEALEKIGNPEEYFFSDWETGDFYLNLGENPDLDEVNEIAEFIDNLGDDEAFKAILEFRSFEEARKIFESGDFSYYDDCRTEKDLGYIVADNMDIPDWLEYYIDYEAIGHDHDNETSGGFTSDGGYLELY